MVGNKNVDNKPTLKVRGRECEAGKLKMTYKSIKLFLFALIYLL